MLWGLGRSGRSSDRLVYIDLVQVKKKAGSLWHRQCRQKLKLSCRRYKKGSKRDTILAQGMAKGRCWSCK